MYLIEILYYIFLLSDVNNVLSFAGEGEDFQLRH